MANNTSIQEQLTYKAIFQIGILIACILVFVFYIHHNLDIAKSNTEQANVSINRYTTITQNGLPFWEFQTKIKNNTSLTETIKEHNDIVRAIITKDKNNTEKYLDWINSTMIVSDEEKQKIQESRAKINSIIPTISPFYENINEDNVTLGDYIAFVEQKILKKFNITSFSSLGIAGIQYIENSVPNNPIGKFQIELNFTNSTVSNILQLLEFIHTSGDLNKTPISWSKNTVMRDPLMTVESFAITESADSRFGDTTVSGKLVINFYIRGSSESDKKFLADTLEKRKEELKTKISSRLKECETEFCTWEEKEKLQNLQSKFNDFYKSLSQSLSEKTSNTTESIYIISQQLQSISSLDEELSQIK